MIFRNGVTPSGAGLKQGAAAALGQIQLMAAASPAAEPAAPAELQGGGLGAALSYRCGDAGCYSYQSPDTNAKFLALQQTINRLAGVAGFSPIKVDGVIGAGTQRALMQIGEWAAKQPYGEVGGIKGSMLVDEANQGWKAVAGRAFGIEGLLQVMVSVAPAPAAAPPKPATSPATAPTFAPPPPGKFVLPQWAYYAIAGVGSLAVLAVAYKLSTPRALPAAATGVAGYGRERGRR